jgi:hypothetical protein
MHYTLLQVLKTEFALHGAPIVHYKVFVVAIAPAQCLENNLNVACRPARMVLRVLA